MRDRFIFPLSASEATDASRFGPKAANLARLGQAGLPIPGGFCVDAEAYRAQIRALGLEADARGVFSAIGEPASSPSRADDEAGLARSTDHARSSRSAARGLAGTENQYRRADGGAIVARWWRIVSDPASRVSLKASWASRAKRTLSRRFAPAGAPCGPRAPCATWPRTISIPRIPPWACWFSHWFRHAPRAADSVNPPKDT